MGLCGREDNRRFIDTPAALRELVERTAGVRRIAVDIESNGMFAYRPRICTVQLAWVEQPEATRVAIVDTLACPVTGLATLLTNPEVLKVIHDLAFDARVLHAEGVDLRSVRDTSVAATYLRKPGTGLASLLENELGIHVGKEMQNSDWARRPLSPDSIAYLAGDVSHLLVLDSLLWGEALEAGIGNEVATETAYRLIDALQTEAEEPLPHVRIRGHERLDGLGRRAIEKIARVREDLGRERDLPPQRILGDKVLLAMAGSRPRSTKDLLRFGQTKRMKQDEQDRILEAIREAVGEGPMEPLPRAPTLPQREVTARKNREKRLQAWRRAEAERRDVHEQVVLPSHCIRWLAGVAPDTAEAIGRTPGLGHTRAERYADRLVAVVRGP